MGQYSPTYPSVQASAPSNPALTQARSLERIGTEKTQEKRAESLLEATTKICRLKVEGYRVPQPCLVPFH